eukprot:1298063-Pleurochrysis_carterae.AAC.1
MVFDDDHWEIDNKPMHSCKMQTWSHSLKKPRTSCANGCSSGAALEPVGQNDRTRLCGVQSLVVAVSRVVLVSRVVVASVGDQLLPDYGEEPAESEACGTIPYN